MRNSKCSTNLDCTDEQRTVVIYSIYTPYYSADLSLLARWDA